MPEGSILLDKEEEEIIYALTLVLFSNNEASFSTETNCEGKTFVHDLNKSYRLICDIKNQLEILRSDYYKESNSCTFEIDGDLND